MLFTRCPECATTFRVTDEALKKANGQVRCGRCASVFNALTERVDADPEVLASTDDETGSATSTPAAAMPPSIPPPATPASAEPDPDAPPRATAAHDPTAVSIGADSVAAVVAEAELAAAELSSTEAGGDADAFSAEQVDEVLATLAEPPHSAPARGRR